MLVLGFAATADARFIALKSILRSVAAQETVPGMEGGEI